MNICIDSPEKEETVIATTEIDEVSFLSYDGSVDQKIFDTLSSQTIPIKTKTQITMNGSASSVSSQVGLTFLGVSQEACPPHAAAVAGPHAFELPPSVSVIIPASKFKPLPYSTARSGLAYDVRMRFHQQIPLEPGDKGYDPLDIGPHPDNPRRISEIFNELAEAGLVEDEKYPEFYSDFQLIRIPVRQATHAELSLVHSIEHVDFVESLTGTLPSVYQSCFKPPFANWNGDISNYQGVLIVSGFVPLLTIVLTRKIKLLPENTGTRKFRRICLLPQHVMAKCFLICRRRN